MRVVGEANKYLSDQAPWKLKDVRARAAARRCCTSRRRRSATAGRCCRRSCRTARRRCTRRSAAPGRVSPMPEIREVDDLDGGPGYPVLMGDYRRGATLPAWGPSPIVPGTPLPPPSPVFRKLDDSVVEEELARLASEAGGPAGG